MPARPPFARVDHLVIAVRDLDAAAATYGTLLGRAPAWRGTHPDLGTLNVLFPLANCTLELLACAPGSPTHPVAVAVAARLGSRPERLLAIALGSDDLGATADALRAAGVACGPITDGRGVAADGATRRWRTLPLDPGATRGVHVFAIARTGEGTLTAPPPAEPASAATAVDHVVLFSDDLDGGLALWRDRFAIPERWRRDIVERGTVNVGLRLGGVTLELVAPLGNAAGERGERLWGVAYRVDDCAAAVARMRAAGLVVSDVRAGLAPATRVATVKRPDGVPTLILEKEGSP